jgi:hypothetical protein
MSIETLLVVLLVWAIAGLLTAIAFGKAIQTGTISSDHDEPLPSSSGAIKYLRRHKDKNHGRDAESTRHHATGKRANG